MMHPGAVLVVLLSAGDAAATPPAAAATPPQVDYRVDVDAVLVDVVVTDRKGGFVAGLTADDFSVRDGGELQTLDHFREVRHPLPGAALPAPASDPAPLAPRHVAFFFDLTSTRRESLPRLWAAGRAVADWAAASLGPDDRVTVASIDPGLKIHIEDQPLTPAVRQVLERLAGSSADAPVDLDFLTGSSIDSRDPHGIPGGWQETIGSYAALDRSTEPERWLVARRFLEALDTLAQRLAARRGKKVLFVVSDGHQLPDESDLGSSRRSGNRTTLRRTVEQDLHRRFSAAGVTVHSIHAAGLEARQGRITETVGALPSGLDRQELLWLVANETGGRLVHDTGNLGPALARIGVDLASYYQLSYAPRGKVVPGQFRRIAVKVRGEGRTVRHRDGYLSPRPYARMGAAERRASLLTTLSGSGVDPGGSAGSGLGGGTPLPGRVLVVTRPLAGDADGLGLGVVVRLPPGSGLDAARAPRLRFLVEARNRLGGVVGSLEEAIELDDKTLRRPLAERGLEFVTGLRVPRQDGSVRVVARDEETGRTLVGEERYAALALPPPILIDSGTPPLLARSHQASAERAALGLLGTGSERLSPRLDDAVVAGQELALLLPTDLTEVGVWLGDGAGTDHPLEPTEPPRAASEGLALVRLRLPAGVPSGACHLEVSGKAGSERYRASLALSCR